MHHSPFHDFHVSMGAKMVEFVGWAMPVSYRGIIEEHVHTRTKCSAFDVSHMGRIVVRGDDAESFLERLCTRRLAGTKIGQSKYTHICKEDGGILDDCIVSRHEDHWLVICNGANREKIDAWLRRHAEGRGIDILDQTLDTAMLAIQGPLALSMLEGVVPHDLKSLKRYWFVEGTYFGMPYSIYRSGYTGEDGVELVIPAAAARMLLPLLFGGDMKAQGDCKPAGLGARDTLRLEAAMPLYGHELSEELDSLSAGQSWCVDLEKDFIGAEAIRRVKADGLKRKVVGLELEGKRIARQHYKIKHNGEVVGEITSGTMSPTLNKSIAMGLLDVECSEPNTDLTVDLGRKENAARVVPLPFYKRPGK